ncbi:hypothetical protein MA04_03577 [Alcanivorax balearicus MACL04]|uniref:Uncharacterized protein n=1 Tax=Alloalcanivorax balearicus MACL04 TaxID=1177182 RepID=A0ABT2R3B9_9GAMM|nr:hypothetical protein [Alloalcanivorax balearicus MACL04]
MVLYKTGLQIRAAFSFIIFFIRFNGLLCFSCYIIVYFFGDGGPLRNKSGMTSILTMLWPKADVLFRFD